MDGSIPHSIGLYIERVLRSDMGNYTLELENDFGVGVSQNAISLDVHCKYTCSFYIYACVKLCAR